MKFIYQNILQQIAQGKKLLAVLIDPDKMPLDNVEGTIKNVNESWVTHIFVGGSTVKAGITAALVAQIKAHTTLPVVLFPGDVTQITNKADGILFLSLLSGRNPEYLIDKQVASVAKLKNTTLEVIPTGYLLIENGKETAVQRVTGTAPMPRHNVQQIVHTAKAGEYMGKHLIYLEAGSGALHPISETIISKVKQELNIPLIVGGGIKNKNQLESAYKAGADLVVIGTAFETDATFFEALKLEAKI
ncbi:geranylgeranylglyceryl phosphate synthase [Mangrovimonas yunxiaonensis]|uniref:Geranylgeranylglyceryl phosphate synthase n=1 Tax=Mangrovimonas yunxiaonensis TaxID=1197477 RepID=A0A084TLC8_9FLAO|nr:geranylgeranylglyceryl/heptaprenylglyceryl phosphate synthase [Mangrovimonas yunxiaonensis]KFB01514.1 geranylgeranylglyceryl phosphate synthase [Mangrovimonas yunxiaonensis]MBR9758353.1 geranylgeranylglyceryl/heptaprenylglyceryl phosphate synthase [Algicola sp.]GGH36239.1 geranylgeranylglyceryl phosphate synthase [Mangrovimonas yunxiaonensis]